jgi:hypothetical protein
MPIHICIPIDLDRISDRSLPFEIHNMIYCCLCLQTRVCITKSSREFIAFVTSREGWLGVPPKTTTFRRSHSFQATNNTNSTSLCSNYLKTHNEYKPIYMLHIVVRQKFVAKKNVEQISNVVSVILYLHVQLYYVLTFQAYYCLK